MRRLLLIAALPLSLAACVDLPDINIGRAPTSETQPAASVADKVVLEGSRAFTIAVLAYDQAVDVARIGLRLVPSGSPIRAKALALNEQALDAIRKGNAATTDAGRAAEAARIFNIEAQLKRLFGSK